MFKIVLGLLRLKQKRNYTGISKQSLFLCFPPTVKQFFALPNISPLRTSSASRGLHRCHWHLTWTISGYRATSQPSCQATRHEIPRSCRPQRGGFLVEPVDLLVFSWIVREICFGPLFDGVCWLFIIFFWIKVFLFAPYYFEKALVRLYYCRGDPHRPLATYFWGLKTRALRPLGRLQP